MSEAYDLFQSSKDAVIVVAKQIEKDFSNFDNRAQMRLAAILIQTICKEVGTPNGQLYNIYSDLVCRVFLPHLEPPANPKQWTFILECIRYYHYSMVEKKQIAIASRICSVIAKKPHKLVTPSDYKILLNIYGQHLLTQRTCAQSSETEEAALMLDAMQYLFKEMQHNKVNDTHLVTEFVNSLSGRGSSRTFDFLAALPASNARKMYDALFALLSAYSVSSTTAPEPVGAYFRRQLEALVVFMDIDLAGELQSRVAMQHLHACRDSSHLQSDKDVGYICSLMYYLFRLLYAPTQKPSFADTYVELCSKFSRYCAKNSASLSRLGWFMDVLVTLNLVLNHAHQPLTTAAFNSYWQHMTTDECFAAHFELIAQCMKLAPHITDTSLTTWKCCGSACKHVQTMFMFSSLSAYLKLITRTPPLAEEQQMGRSPQLLDTLNANLLEIVRQGVRALVTMSCTTDLQSRDIKGIYYYFTQITRDSKTPEQARRCVALGELLVPLSSKFDAGDWVLTLRRIMRVSMTLVDQPQLSADLHSCYVAMLLQRAPQQLDWTELRTLVGAYYATGGTHQKQPPSCCLLDQYERSQSVFKASPLTPQQRRCLQSLEVQYVRFFRTNGALQASLLACYPGDHDAVMVARASKLQGVEPNTGDRLRRLCATLNRDKVARTRLEQLIRGFACTVLMQDAYEIQRKLLEISSNECTEECLADLLQCKDVVSMNLQEEQKFVQLGQQAIEAFRLFYDRADAEPISSLDVYIDWECLLDDVASVAQLFELCGYVESATNAWLLLYRIANGIMDSYTALRAFSYFCEHAEYFDDDVACVDAVTLNLPREIAANQETLLHALARVSTLPLRQQTEILCCVCHLAYYYARADNIVYAELLLMLVRQQLELLPERAGKFEVVLATVRIVSFRIFWKHQHLPKTLQQKTRPLPLLERVIMRDIEDILDSFRDIVYVSSADAMRYTNLLVNVVEQFGECAANRLTEPLLNGIFASALKITLQMRTAMRTVQILTMWVYGNLQREEIQKAQIKLLLIECFVGVRDLEQLTKPSSGEVAVPAKKHLVLSRPLVNGIGGGCSADALSMNILADVEPMRKAYPQVQPSPLDIAKSRTRGLLSFLRRHKTLQRDAQLEWTYVVVGCMNARLLYLARDFDQLPEFYEGLRRWWREQRNVLLLRHYRNMQLLSEHHYVNYLRASGQLSAALERLDEVLAMCATKRRNSVDCVYWATLLQQRNDTRNQQKLLLKQEDSENKTSSLSRLSITRRALAFEDVTPPEENNTPVTLKVEQGNGVGVDSEVAIKSDVGTDAEDDLNMCIVNLELDDSSIICIDDVHDQQQLKEKLIFPHVQVNGVVHALQEKTKRAKSATKKPARTAKNTTKTTEKPGIENNAMSLNAIPKSMQSKSTRSRKIRFVEKQLEIQTTTAVDEITDLFADMEAADEPLAPSVTKNAKKTTKKTTKRTIKRDKDAISTPPTNAPKTRSRLRNVDVGDALKPKVRAQRS